MTFNNMLENFARKSSKNQGHSNKGRPEVKLLFGYSGFWSCPLNPLALVLPGGQVYSLVVVIYFFWSNKQPFQFVSDSVPTFVVVWIRKKLRTKHVPLYLQLHGHMQRTEFKWSEFPFNGTVLGVGAENDKDIIWDTLVVRTNYPLPFLILQHWTYAHFPNMVGPNEIRDIMRIITYLPWLWSVKGGKPNWSPRQQ